MINLLIPLQSNLVYLFIITETPYKRVLAISVDSLVGYRIHVEYQNSWVVRLAGGSCNSVPYAQWVLYLKKALSE